MSKNKQKAVSLTTMAAFMGDLQNMTGEEILHVIYTKRGKFLLRLLAVSGGNDCQSVAILSCMVQHATIKTSHYTGSTR